MTLLDVDNINGYYGESHIIQDVSMNVDDGEITALLGRNGAGKTSTLRCISGATPPDVRSGAIQFDGTDITNDPPEDIAVRGISLVPEERRVFTDLTVAENLHLADTVRNKSNTWGRNLDFRDEGMSTEEIYEYFPRLDERRSQKAGTLSGGEQQMLAIARALHQSTDLLMLDEPYEGLAPQIIESVENAIERISEDGTTILLVEQNAVAAMKIADRCYVLDRGQVVFEGPAEELQNDQEMRDKYLGV
ncbi:ABC transporter ATP-binding protein [Haloarcula sp. CBA1130]|uniref:ABC transporter ATP-binding protein n=1 Tax=unclassified Haloarcula TaxID=2624677 RepID=UPI0012452871|nr:MULTISPECIES: ABC transporter ATP-binding protein [unclassified Haloarcula]KAA9399094.1 ABC transporter ATP-binding protein [Haloarcula sp. CBA1129]KAA9403607.1 ABC transporter ATP-binding protein [Haloarcula sp. CBA1130]